MVLWRSCEAMQTCLSSEERPTADPRVAAFTAVRLRSARGKQDVYSDTMTKDQVLRRHVGCLAVVCLLLAALFLGGCWQCPFPDPDPVPEPAAIELAEESTGWVQVRIAGSLRSGAQIAWGDDPDARTTVTPGFELYEHFYHENGEYTVDLIVEGTVVATTTVTIDVSDCHAVLLDIDGLEVMIRYWGRYGVDYRIVWGDGTATSFIGSFDPEQTSHTYAQPGTYTIRMGGTWAPAQPKIEVTVE